MVKHEKNFRKSKIMCPKQHRENQSPSMGLMWPENRFSAASLEAKSPNKLNKRGIHLKILLFRTGRWPSG